MSNITASDLIKAFKNTARHRSQIQGFFYQTNDGIDQHVARDLTAPEGEQVFFRLCDNMSGSNYDMLAQRQTEAIEERIMEIVAAELNAIKRRKQVAKI